MLNLGVDVISNTNNYIYIPKNKTSRRREWKAIEKHFSLRYSKYLEVEKISF
jgi:hypothetical protein